MKVWVDKDTCIACGACYNDVPEVYASDDEGFAYALPEIADDVPADLQEKAREGLASCPTESIKIEE